jgi:hypothetical protein
VWKKEKPWLPLSQMNGYVTDKLPPHPDQKQANLLKKTGKIGNLTKDSGWIQPPEQ